MLVLKFGGSSVKNAQRIQQVTEIIRDRLHLKPALVFSAMGDTTDQLLKAGENALQGIVDISAIEQLHRDSALSLSIDFAPLQPLLDELRALVTGISLLKELSSKTKDYLVSFGERLSVRLIAAHLSQVGIAAQHFDAWDIGFRTNSQFTEAELLEETYDNVAAALGPMMQSYTTMPVVTGYIAHDPAGAITTLGRGGTDLTASVLGASLGVDEIQVWKDVDGILTTDPRLVPTAQPVPLVSFEEASELAYFGAKVLHPLSIQPAMRKNIPVRVKNSYNPEHPGSLIVETAERDPQLLVKAITCKRKVTLVDIVSTRCLGQPGFLARVFQLFADHEISVDMVATSEVSVSLTLNYDYPLERILERLGEFATVTVSREKAILSLIGNIDRSSEILDTAFATLHRNGVAAQMISHGASKVNIGIIVEDNEVEHCLQQMHHFFFDDTTAPRKVAA